jgi:hypothetical protein
MLGLTTFKINAVVQQLVLHDKSYHVSQAKSEQVNQAFGEFMRVLKRTNFNLEFSENSSLHFCNFKFASESDNGRPRFGTWYYLSFFRREYHVPISAP